MMSTIISKKDYQSRYYQYAYNSRKYRELVGWIAEMDNSGSEDGVDDIAGYITTVMIAHVYTLSPRRVAQDVYYLRTYNQEVPR